jgi:hypothetical protein
MRPPTIHMTKVSIAIAVVALAVSSCGTSAQERKQTGDLPGVKEFGLTEEEFTAHVEETQTLIADCMAAAGFDYIPVDVKTIEAAQGQMRMESGYTRRTYKEKWGLGVTTRFDNPVRDTGLGPNLAIYEGLPEAERIAYERTLWGENPDADFVFTLDEEDFSDTGGCTREAVSQVFTPAQMKGTYVNPKDVVIDADPRIIEAHQRWSECMHDAGYEYEYDQDEIIEEYQDRLDELLEGDDPTTLTGSRAAALRKLQEEEIAVSLVDLQCQIEYTDDVYREVELEVYGQTL